MKVLKGFILIIVMVALGYLAVVNNNEVTTESHSEEKKAQSGREKIESNLSNPVAATQQRSQANSKEQHEIFSDDEYKALLNSGSFKEAISHIIKKSEEHIGGQPNRDDFIKKLGIMSQYIDYDPSILKRDFDFFIGYYSLNAYDRREDRMTEMEELLEDTYKTQSKDTHYCLGFYRESGRRSINYSQLASSVVDCASNENRRSIVFDYVNFLKDTKDENYAMQEYTKLRLMHNELPEYGAFYQSN